jgi:hypothetical protein
MKMQTRLMPATILTRRRTRSMSARLPLLLAMIFSTTSVYTQSRNPSPELRNFLNSHIQARPAMDAQDAYKLLYQGSFGVGHLITDTSRALAFLEREMAAMDRGVEDPLIEYCDPAGVMLRVNLRPFAARGLSPRLLLDAMLESVERITADTSAFTAQWDSVGVLIEAGAIPLHANAYRAITDLARRRNYPAMHHSAPYKERYKPAYRVLLTAVARERFPSFFD